MTALPWSHDPFDPGVAQLVVAAPGPGPGNWAGAASAVHHAGQFFLAYRVRRPAGEGRGVSVVVARSDDGVVFEPVCEVTREGFGAESFERPALVRRPGGGWRLYLSCATPGSKHWWVEALDADHLEDLPSGERTKVLPGDDATGVKDPVVLVDDDGWRMWVCCHPLSDPGHEDRMSTAYAESVDGLTWTRPRTVLIPTPGTWDARGTRVTAVLADQSLTVLYDGRATAEQNWHETTGLAGAADGQLVAEGGGPVGTSPHSDGALRYVAAVPLGDRRVRFYYEAARPDGAHDLLTSVVVLRAQ